MTEIVLKPGDATLADWRAIYRGAVPRLDPACGPKIAASAAAVARIVAKGEPVYGINTGFGKLASVRIPADDLETLQRNIVLSHAAGVGEPMPVAVVRLMMALKLASLAQGASGVQPETVALLEAMLASDVVPVVPAQGSVGASGDLAPLAHMTAAMIGVGEAIIDGDAHVRRRRRWRRPGWQPVVLGRQGRPGAAQRHAVLDRLRAGRPVRRRARCRSAALVTGALSTDAAKGSDAPFDPRIHALRGHRGQIETAAALRALMAGSAIRACHLVGDERVQDPYCLRCQPQVMGACLDLLRQAAATLETEANGVTDNPLMLRRR